MLKNLFPIFLVASLRPAAADQPKQRADQAKPAK